MYILYVSMHTRWIKKKWKNYVCFEEIIIWNGWKKEQENNNSRKIMINYHVGSNLYSISVTAGQTNHRYSHIILIVEEKYIQYTFPYTISFFSFHKFHACRSDDEDELFFVYFMEFSMFQFFSPKIAASKLPWIFQISSKEIIASQQTINKLFTRKCAYIRLLYWGFHCLKAFYIPSYNRWIILFF